MNKHSKIFAIILVIAVAVGLVYGLFNIEPAATDPTATDPTATVPTPNEPVVSDAPVTYDTVVGTLVDEDGNSYGITITYGDLRSDEYLKVGFPNDEVRNKLQGELYDLLVQRNTFPDEPMTDEYREDLREVAFGIMGYYEPANTTDIRLPLYYADIPDEYRMIGFGDPSAKYIINLRREADRKQLRVPEWVEYSPDYEVICAAPGFVEDMLFSTNTAVTAWVGNRYPEATVTVENGATLEVDGRFLEEGKNGEYRFVGCWAVENAEFAAENAPAAATTVIDPSSVTPCMIEVDYDKKADAFCVDLDFCEETLNNNRPRSFNDRLPQNYEDCFVPIYDAPVPVLDVPDGSWTQDYTLTCVFTSQCFIGIDDEVTSVEVYNAISKDGEGNMGCLLIREDGANLWIENALFCYASFDDREINTEDTLQENDGIVTACDHVRLWCTNATTPAGDVFVYVDGTRGWDIS